MQRDLLLLGEMIDAAEQARSLVAGRTVAEIESDRLRRDAPMWNFTVLGGYWSVDVGILHTTAAEQLGEFVRMLRDAVSALEGNP